MHVAACTSPGGRFGDAERDLFGRPKGAAWTILAAERQGPYAVRNTERLAQMLRQVEGIKKDEVVVSHDQDGASRIYYGTYYRKRDPETDKLLIPDALRRDMQVIKFLQTEDGVHHFALALKVPKPLPDVGDPAWALQRVEKPYTLQIAVFEAGEVSNHKQAAADLCEQLRKQGYEAYYHHGIDASVVTVGSFDRDAVRVVEGRAVYSHEVIELQSKEWFRYNITNGRRLTVHKYGRQTPVSSQLMVVPGHAQMELEEVRSDPWRSPGQ